MNIINSLDDLRINASTPETRIINSSGDGTNIGIHESNVGPNTSLMSTIGNLTQLFADQEDQEVMINNQQNNGTSSFGIGSDCTIPPNRTVEPTNTNIVEANEGNPIRKLKDRFVHWKINLNMIGNFFPEIQKTIRIFKI